MAMLHVCHLHDCSGLHAALQDPLTRRASLHSFILLSSSSLGMCTILHSGLQPPLLRLCSEKFMCSGLHCRSGVSVAYHAPAPAAP